MIINALQLLLACFGVLQAFAQSFEYPYGNSDVSIVQITPNSVFVGGGDGFYQYHVTIDVQFAVKNLAYTKTVGIRFTNDSWATYQEQTGSYVKSIGNNYELWSLTIDRGYLWNTQLSTVTEYVLAGFASFNNGPREWDPLNNYYVYYNANPTNPAFFIGDSVSVNAKTQQVFLTGSIRAYAFQPKDLTTGVASIRWTVNNWKTYTDSPATAISSNSTFTWSINVGSASSLPANVTYAIHYASSGKDFWLNNNNNNFVKTLKPTVTYAGSESLAAPLNGALYFGANVVTDLAVANYSLFVDNKILPADNFINTQTIGKGAHTFKVQVYLNSSSTVQTYTFPFTVLNHVTYLDTWIPVPPPSVPINAFGANAWSIASNAAGNIYVGYDGPIIAKYNKYGTTANATSITTFTGAAAFGSVNNLILTDTHVIAFGTGGSFSAAFLNNSYPDASFGTNGTFKVPPVVNGTQVCYAGFATVTNAKEIFVSDTCGQPFPRLIKFNWYGQFIKELAFPNPSYINNGAVAVKDAYTVVVSSLTFDALNNQVITLFEVDPVSLTIKRQIPLPNSPSAFSYLTNGLLAYTSQLGSNELVFVNATTGGSSPLGVWQGSVGPADNYLKAGMWDVISSAVDLRDGSVAALGVTGTIINRFSQTLQ